MHFVVNRQKKGVFSRPPIFSLQKFIIADTVDYGIALMYSPIKDGVNPPKLKDCAKLEKIDQSGFVLYYTDQCPFTYYWVPRIQEVAKANNIPLKAIHITSLQDAQNVLAPVTTYALFKAGKFITHSILIDKKFLALANKK